MGTKILLKDESLWKRIQSFSLDASDADFPFSKKLAKEESWTLDFAQKAIREYKKFVYLCCILPNGASPSETVDKVWHMHLIYTQNYWEEFCPNILKRKLHHHPSKGGRSEKKKHQDWHTDTLHHYKEIFQQDAPKDIWTDQIIKKDKLAFWTKSFKLLTLISLLFLVYSCSGSFFGGVMLTILSVIGFFIFMSFLSWIFEGNTHKEQDKNISSNNSDGGSSCSGGSSCGGGGGCGGGCGGCGG
ncbi:glycine-rich domain-containing protein [Chryseobacterium tongliaoense]|uniref:glycine-rich domain-containing protein n=1 Tax=Chryseobacterium tongliaoense TaxID=3240933 RepID=UPI0035135FAE